MVVYDSQQKSVNVGREIGEGGEATVYQLVEQPGLLVKIYNGSPRPGYERKLSWMQTNPPHNPTRAQGHASIAWPLDLLYDQHGQFVGYLMPYVRNAVSLLEVFNPRRRAKTLPGFNWQYLHRTARNLAIALDALHVHGYVVGDLNESNIMVTPSALVTLIDTDSFQIRAVETDRTVVYPCPVGKPEYTPPELQGKSLRQTPRLPEHDCFGLGVLIFQLLMNGSHPFRAQWLGSDDPPPLEERIRLGCFPHMDSPPCPVASPRHAPTLDTLHPRLAKLVRQCFVDGDRTPQQRPMPDMWARVLAQAEEALVICQNGHYYADHLADCPQCIRQRARRQVVRRAPAPTGVPPLIRPSVATPPALPIVATPISKPISSSPTATPLLPATAPSRWQLWRGWTAILLTVLLFGAGIIAAVDAMRPGAAEAPPTATPFPTYTPLPTVVEFVPITLPSPSPTPRPRPTNTPSPIPTDTPSPTPSPTNPPPPAPTPTRVTGDPEVFIALSGGDTYNRGDSIRVTLAIRDPDGVGNVYWWVTNAENKAELFRRNQWCNNAPECSITEEVRDLAPGTFNIFVAAFDTRRNGTLKEAQIFVRQ